MTSEVIIDVQPKDIAIALLEDKQLVEYQNEPRSASFSVGNVYIGKVRKLMPGLNACFVDVGSEKDAFLHYLDMGLQFSSYEKFNLTLTKSTSNRYRATGRNFIPSKKPSICPIFPRTGVFRTN